MLICGSTNKLKGTPAESGHEPFSKYSISDYFFCRMLTKLCINKFKHSNLCEVRVIVVVVQYS